MAGRNRATPDTVETRVVPDFEVLLAEIEANDSPPTVFHIRGTEFTILNPLQWSDEVLRLQSAAQRTEDPAVMVSLAEELLGEQYPAFRELGGSAMKLNRVLEKLLGAELGESSAS